MLDLVLKEEIFNTFSSELGLIICHNNSRKSESTNNIVLNELYYLLLSDGS